MLKLNSNCNKIVIDSKIVASDNKLKILAKTIFLKLFPWTNKSFNLPLVISVVYILKERKIKNSGIINWKSNETLNNQIDHFSRVVLKKEKPKVTGKDGLNSLIIFDAINKSSQSGKKIRIN